MTVADDRKPGYWWVKRVGHKMTGPREIAEWRGGRWLFFEAQPADADWASSDAEVMVLYSVSIFG
jgi:hypothetical protein